MSCMHHWFAMSCLLVLAGCHASVYVTRSGPSHAPREANCELTLVSPSDMYPGGKLEPDHEIVGTITIHARGGAQASDPEVKAELRPRACALSADAIALGSSMKVLHGLREVQVLNFLVYAPKGSSAPQKY